MTGAWIWQLIWPVSTAMAGIVVLWISSRGDET